MPVLLFHAGFPAARGGYVGVDVFFVISGYLITALIQADLAQGRFSLKKFYERRMRRILPALALVVSLIFIPCCLFMPPNQLKDFGQSLVAVGLSASNFLFWRKTGYFASAVEFKPLLHTWSLAVEEQFYLVFPLFMLGLRRWRRESLFVLLSILALASLALAQMESTRDPVANFYLAPGRAWEILAGSLVAMGANKFQGRFSRMAEEALSFAGLAMILLAVVLFSSSTPFPSLYALLPVVGTVLVIAFAAEKTLAYRVLSSRGMVGLGLISYGAYLWHQPLFALSRLLSRRQLPPSFFTLPIALSLSLAYLTWRFVEKPFRDRARFSAPKIYSLSLIFLASIIAVGAGLHFTEGLEREADPRVRIFEAAIKSANPRQRECESEPGRYIPPSMACELGAAAAPVTVALMGDSHADALFRALEIQLEKRGLRAKFFSYVGCAPVPGLVVPSAPQGERCPRYNAEVAAYLKATPSIRTVIVAARWTIYLEGERFDNGEGGVEWGPPYPADPVVARDGTRADNVARLYREAIENLSDGTRKIILVYPVPEAGWDVPAYLAKSVQVYRDEITPSLGGTDAGLFGRRNRRSVEAFDGVGERSNLVRVRPGEILCGSFVAGRCAVQVDGVPLYLDNNHLSLTGADLVVRRILPYL